MSLKLHELLPIFEMLERPQVHVQCLIIKSHAYLRANKKQLVRTLCMMTAAQYVYGLHVIYCLVDGSASKAHVDGSRDGVADQVEAQT